MIRMRSPIALSLAIALTAFLVYLPSLWHGFTNFDDDVLIRENLPFISDPSNAIKVFSGDVFLNRQESPGTMQLRIGYYRPMMTLSLMADTVTGNGAPAAYHLTNILLHSACSVLVLYLFLALGYPLFTGALAASVFSVHPVISQAVYWIPGRNDSLVTLFILLAFILLAKYIRSGGLLVLGLHTLVFIMAVLTKETALLLPFVALVYIWVSGGAGLLKKSVPLIVSWSAVMCLFLILRALLMTSTFSVGPLESIFSVVGNMPALLLYLGKAVFPFNLTVVPVLSDSTLLFGIIAAAWMAVLYLKAFRGSLKMSLFGGLWALVFLLPTFIQPYYGAPANFSEHRLYLPMAGLLIVIAELAGPAVLSLSKIRTVLLVTVTVFAAITVVHARYFTDELSFLNEAVKSSPSLPRTHACLAEVYFERGDNTKALEQYELAVKMCDKEPLVHNNIGVIHLMTGRPDEALEEFVKEWNNYPGERNVNYNMGLVFLMKKDREKAVRYFRKELEVSGSEQAAEALRSLGSSK